MLRAIPLIATAFVAMTATHIAAQEAPKRETPADSDRWAIVIHGGAGVIEKKKLTKVKDKAIRIALKGALEAGSKVLAEGGTSLDAVTAAVKSLEDDPNFNAGKGAVLTYDGTFALDAAIMDGKSRKAGAVAGTTIAKNPILAARRVMEDSPHVMLSGPGADEFVREQGLETETQDYFETPERRQQLETMKAKAVSSFDVDQKYGTVGAVALDKDGHVAAATSTGGMTGKRWGRIGDAPVIGAGTYADDRACAVSATGAGEYFIKVGVAHEICARIRMKGDKGLTAAKTVMAEVKALGGDGGVIFVTPDGQLGWSFNTIGMYRGGKDSSGREVVAIYGDE